ncbi:hypothetical protein Pfo_008494 [Paulownia fortunei]|nr:hypothetical protein Pfo_008494 [Paulownia fortunei]
MYQKIKDNTILVWWPSNSIISHPVIPQQPCLTDEMGSPCHLLASFFASIVRPICWHIAWGSNIIQKLKRQSNDIFILFFKKSGQRLVSKLQKHLLALNLFL